jgi:hypothetical protein
LRSEIRTTPSVIAISISIQTLASFPSRPPF